MVFLCTSSLLPISAIAATVDNTEISAAKETSDWDETMNNITDNKNDEIQTTQSAIKVSDSKDTINKIEENNTEITSMLEIQPRAAYTYASTSTINGSKLSMSIVYSNGSSTTLTCSVNTEVAKGDRGTAVKMLQAGLNTVMNSGLTVDGSFGSSTESALKSFQRRFLGSNQDDGITGNKTWTALNNCIN